MIKLKDLRESSKISGPKLANVLGITTQYYYDLEKGNRRLNEDILNKLADFYKVSVDYILGRELKKELPVQEAQDNKLYAVIEKAKNRGISAEKLDKLIELLGDEK